jgi:aminoglycoside phosphotransferase (APT) family kinase protein
VTTDWYGAPVTPLSGGYSGETFLVGADPAEQVVLRIYRREPERAVIDAGLLRLMRGVLPVPRVLEVRPASADEPAVLVTSRLAGTPLDVALRDHPDALDLVALGTSLGDALARLSGVPFADFGMFVGADLGVSRHAVPSDLAEFARHQRDSGRIASWRDDDFDALVALVDRAGDLSDAAAAEAESRYVLVHSDFNAKNLLVDLETSQLCGVLDWEFAHAGSPYADLGNLTRFDRAPTLLETTVATLLERAPRLAADPLAAGRAADLWALLELAGRVESNPVCELATQLLQAQARTGDLHAWPWDTPRVDPKQAKRVR